MSWLAVWSSASACTLLADTSNLVTPGNGDIDAGHVDAPSSDAAGRWCAQQASDAFCDDFDDGTLPGRWDQEYVRGGRNMLSSDTALSAPSAYVATVDPASLGGQAMLRKGFVAPTNEVHLAFAWQIARVDPGGGRTMRVAELQLLSADGEYYLEFGVESDRSVHANERRRPKVGSQGFIEHRLPRPVAVGVWMNVRIDATFTGAPKLAVAIDDQPALTVGLSPVSTRAEANLYLGATYTPDPTTGWEFRFDNVLCTVK